MNQLIDALIPLLIWLSPFILRWAGNRIENAAKNIVTKDVNTKGDWLLRLPCDVQLQIVQGILLGTTINIDTFDPTSG